MDETIIKIQQNSTEKEIKEKAEQIVKKLLKDKVVGVKFIKEVNEDGD